jgi:hypothetical protein
MTKTTHYARTADADRPVLGRRLSWEEFYQLRPDRRPANDNTKASSKAA